LKKLAIIATHPVQYYAPVLKLLSQRKGLTVKVFYTWGKNSANKYDPGFKKNIEWDIPLLEGYSFEWAINSSKDPGTHHFGGIVNPMIIEELELWQADAILIYGWGFNSHLKIIRHFKKKIPIYFRGDSTLLDAQKGVKYIFRSIFLKWVYKHIDYAFYVGTNNKNYYLKFALSQNQLKFAPHAVDNDRFAFDRTNDAKLLREQLGIKEEEILILFAGKIEEKKAPLQLLTAFNCLKKTGVHLLYVGNGSLEHLLKMTSKQDKNIHFMDFQNQSYMPVAYQACDIFCLPSIGPNETWGLAINEAMACGKAILSSDKVGSAVDLVNPGFNGEIFRAGDPADLVYRLKLLLEKGKNELGTMGANSKEIIKNWSFEKQVNVIGSTIENEERSTIY
jgi:glycosyltransferase involved in cell wall biosynthesis